ncbi:MAG TPA: pyridoxal-dependent decarboxylase, partial [Candidatus Paceibacterota bacterium]|nr:pyridoxal-dependent decarboxylase [Candidatus Paceibacterota bacterium]
MSFLADSEVVTRALAAYCQESVAGQGRVINQEPLEQIIEKLDLNRYARDGGLTGPELAAFLDRYLTFTTRLHHPAYMAHQVAVPCPTAALGSLIDGLTNNAMAIYEMGPGAASIEFWVLNWMLQKVGWQPAAFDRQKRARDPSYAGGVLTHGGSLANLTAMLAARHRAVPDVWAHGIPQNLVLLAPAGAHYSIARAAGILGLGQNAVRHLEVDALGRIIPEKLALTYDRIRQEDKRPMALVAS